jgi:hypothetical protein
LFCEKISVVPQGEPRCFISIRILERRKRRRKNLQYRSEDEERKEGMKNGKRKEGN